MTLKYSHLRTVFSMSECAKTHLQQYKIFKFSGIETLGSPLQTRRLFELQFEQRFELWLNTSTFLVANYTDNVIDASNRSSQILAGRHFINMGIVPTIMNRLIDMTLATTEANIDTA